MKARLLTALSAVAVGALHAVLGADLLDVEHGDAQVAVVLQRQFDQRAQARIGQEVGPGQIGRCRSRARGG